MRLEELAYIVDGLPVTVGFAGRLTVMDLSPADERAAWLGRLLGVLEGMRPGDGGTVVWVDHAGQRVRLERDEHGAATLTDLATGGDLAYSAAHLSLDGRFDWFASIGITARTAADLMVVDTEAFIGDEKREGTSPRRLSRARGVLAELESVASACRALARRRDALVDRVDDGDALRELVDEVEPAFVEALAALAGAFRPHGVSLDAARLEAAGIGAAGIVAVTRDMLEEVATLIAEPEADPADEPGAPAAGGWLVTAEEAEAILLRRAAEVCRVGPHREPLPLVVNDALAPFADGDKQALLDVVARLAESTQVVYLTGDADTLAWAANPSGTPELSLWRPEGFATVA